MIIKINKSYHLAGFIAALALTGSVCIALTTWSWMVKLLFFTVILAGSVREIRRACLLAAPASVVALSVVDNHVRVWRRGESPDSDGVVCTVHRRYVHSRVVILVLKPVTEGPAFRLVLTRTMCGENDFRALKRYLLWDLKEQAGTVS